MSGKKRIDLYSSTKNSSYQIMILLLALLEMILCLYNLINYVICNIKKQAQIIQ